MSRGLRSAGCFTSSPCRRFEVTQRPSRKPAENGKAWLNRAKNSATDEGLGNPLEIISIAVVAKEEETRGAFRYDAIVATFVGVCALFVSGYTAYVQRQQVRAAVWPILEFYSSNAPDIHFTIANKGVGPAIIRNVIVKVDDQPVKNWYEVLDRIVGPGEHPSSESDMSGRVFAAVNRSRPLLRSIPSANRSFSTSPTRTG